MSWHCRSEPLIENARVVCSVEEKGGCCTSSKSSCRHLLLFPAFSLLILLFFYIVLNFYNYMSLICQAGHKTQQPPHKCEEAKLGFKRSKHSTYVEKTWQSAWHVSFLCYSGNRRAWSAACQTCSNPRACTNDMMVVKLPDCIYECRTAWRSPKDGWLYQEPRSNQLGASSSGKP